MTEYYTPKEFGEKLGLTYQTIMRKILKLEDDIEYGKLIIKKDGKWLLHKNLLDAFKKVKRHKIFAFSIDFPKNNEKEIYDIMSFIANEGNIIFDYSIESKKKNNNTHIHGIAYNTTKNHLQKLIYAFTINSFSIKPVFDEKGWLNYITKENKEIIHINPISTQRRR